VLTLKDNQGTLYEDVRQLFIDGLDNDFAGVEHHSCRTACPSGRRVKSDASDARLGSWTAGVDRFSVSLGE